MARPAAPARPTQARPPDRRPRTRRPTEEGRRSGPDVLAVVGATPGRCVGGLPDHHLAAEEAHLLTVLVEALRLHRHDAPVLTRTRRLHVEHLRLGVDGVAVE